MAHEACTAWPSAVEQFLAGQQPRLVQTDEGNLCGAASTTIFNRLSTAGPRVRLPKGYSSCLYDVVCGLDVEVVGSHKLASRGNKLEGTPRRSQAARCTCLTPLKCFACRSAA